MSEQPMIEYEDVHKRFDAPVLGGVNLSVMPGETISILGTSGTGKSVLLKHIIGLLKPDSGTVQVDGVAVEGLSNREITEFRRKFGMSRAQIFSARKRTSAMMYSTWRAAPKQALPNLLPRWPR